ncbi:hypothetical protein BHYA_0120g00210 [Botrytis hyacinthi]|uniref:Uncharacterized protein n=1 Tax=Botrytis hyacinthi TaxID=278943 RepID=A0A4Z1GIA1_9HELO|nr:hypothetical protein BHYA_0120g00210 [Botrytis hyacinthi]
MKDSEYPIVCYFVDRFKGIEKGDPDIPVSVAASMVNSHYLGFDTDVDYISIIKITPNAQKSHTHSVPKVLGLQVQNDVENKDLCMEYWEGAIPFWEKLGQPVSGKNNLPKGKARIASQYIYDFIEAQNAKNEYFARQIAGADYPFDYPRH